MSREASLDARFAALADPTRRRIVERLARGESTVGEIAAPFDMSLPAVSRHVRVLEEAGMVKRWRDGKHHKVRLEKKALAAPSEWLDRTEQMWGSMLDRMERMFEEDEE